MTNIPPFQQSSGDTQLKDFVSEEFPHDPPQYAVGQDKPAAEIYTTGTGEPAQRPNNVYSGLSMDDIEAAQTLEVLRSGLSRPLSSRILEVH